MNAELLSVGTELLLGEILNTDAKFLAEELSAIGINLYYQTTVGDNPERLKNALTIALSRADLVIASGGLGPTPDDLTKEVIAEAMGEPLVLHQKSWEDIQSYFKNTKREMPESNKKQAMMPEHAIVLENHNGTAPGCIIEKNQKIVVILPGPPNELQPMYTESVKPHLLKKTGTVLYSKNYRLFGIGEAKVAEIMQKEMEEGKNPTLAPYAETAGVRLRLTAACKNQEEGEKLLHPLEQVLKERLGEYIYSEEDKSLAETVVERLLACKKTISAAESCTGGMFSKMIVDCAGSSAIFRESVVTYANEAKERYLGVQHETLEKFGAVSRETAREMAEGIKKKSGADFGIGITGLAGPDGGTKEKPVGLVYVGIADQNGTEILELHLAGNREKVRYSACMHAFFAVYQKIRKSA